MQKKRKSFDATIALLNPLKRINNAWAVILYSLTALLVLIPSAMTREHNLDKPAIGKIHNAALQELSGIIPALEKAEFWGHNDKNNAPELFRFNSAGKILQTVLLTGLKNHDWEGITKDNNGYLYIGAFGDNSEERDDYQIHKIKEPKPNEKTLSSLETFTYRYSDNKSHNCEAFFMMNGSFYFITKEKDEENEPTLFELSAPSKSKTNRAKALGKMQIKGRVTDANYSKQHKLLAVLTYETIYLFKITNEKDILSAPFVSATLDYKKCEGLCFDDDNLILTNEHGEIWSYSVQDLLND